jgi:hypothetical protein
LSDPVKHLVASLLACGLFGYAVMSSLVFYRRMRRQIAEYKRGPLQRVVHSPQYGLTIWLTGAIGIIGFLFASWQLVLSMLAILRAG